MDPNIMKLLEEDEDETMHSGADVDAFTAELNRDIEGNSSQSQQPLDSDSAALSQWQTSAHDGNVNFQSGQDLMVTEQTDQHSSGLELQQHGPDSFNPKVEDGFANELSNLHYPSTSSEIGFPNAQDEQKTFAVSQPMSTQASGNQPVIIHNSDHEPKPVVDKQTQNSQNMSDQQSIPMGSNNQQSTGMELNNQQSLPTGTGTQQSVMGIGNSQDIETMNRHSTGMGMNSQQPAIPGLRNQESMTSSFTQPGTSMRNKQVPFGMLLPIIQPQLDKDRAMQLHTLYFKLKKNEITKDDFVRHMRSIVGDQMLKMAVYKLQTQAGKQQAPSQFPSQNQPPGRQLQVPSTVQMQTNLSNPVRDSNTSNPREMDNHTDLQGVQVSQMATSGFVSASQERKHHVFAPGINKQHAHFSQTSFPAYGSSGGSYQSFSPSSASIRPHTHTTAHQSMTSVKHEHADQSSEQQKAQLIPTHASSSMPLIKQGNATPGHSMDDSSRMGYPPPANMTNSRAPAIPPTGPPKAPPRKPVAGQKKPMEAPGSSPPSSKKQKVSGGFLDQSIEQLNDVTAVSGVNLREEEEQMLSGSKEDSRISEISRRVVQEEEEKLILQKVPLQKKVAEIMAKYGVKSMGTDVERCLSLCVEERMRGLIFNLVRLSKQRVDMEKPRHRTIITSDIRHQILTINRKAQEEMDKKQAETEKSLKLTDTEGGAIGDGDKEKDEGRLKPTKVNKEEDDKMRATAANVAVRAATGVGDVLSKWQLMIEAKQKQGGTDTAPSAAQPGKDMARKPSQASTKNTRESQEGEKGDSSAAFSTPASGRKVGRNQVAARRVARTITVKDVIAILEREPQMSKSTLLYRLYERVSADAAPEND